uniref:HNH nuclease domain-containing protein n=1 Tax=viral metagenome TaxID=1070528 RepID=A0A6C0IKF0_9ZZZZ
MKFELLIFGLTAFFIANTYHDGKYLTIMKSWKKYYQMASIGFVGLSAYLFMKKYPGHSRSLFTHANGIIKYLPIDRDATNFLFDLTDKREMFSSNNNSVQGNRMQGNRMQGNRMQGNRMQAQEQRVMNSGMNTTSNNGSEQKATKRSVSETKKKFVAAQQGWKCGACKQQLPAWFEVDHKIRLDNGGSNHVDNLVALCRDCHGKKTAFENL